MELPSRTVYVRSSKQRDCLSTFLIVRFGPHGGVGCGPRAGCPAGAAGAAPRAPCAARLPAKPKRAIASRGDTNTGFMDPPANGIWDDFTCFLRKQYRFVVVHLTYASSTADHTVLYRSHVRRPARGGLPDGVLVDAARRAPPKTRRRCS